MNTTLGFESPGSQDRATERKAAISVNIGAVALIILETRK